jgi:hypothetical protein
VDKNAVVDWTSYMREICVNPLLNHPLLSSPNMLVEIDEDYQLFYVVL